MVMKAEPILRAVKRFKTTMHGLEQIRRCFSPHGRPFTQVAKDLATDPRRLVTALWPLRGR
jgi:tRNA G37 N-methylase TrmD